MLAPTPAVQVARPAGAGIGAAGPGVGAAPTPAGAGAPPIVTAQQLPPESVARAPPGAVALALPAAACAAAVAPAAIAAAAAAPGVAPSPAVPVCAVGAVPAAPGPAPCAGPAGAAGAAAPPGTSSAIVSCEPRLQVNHNLQLGVPGSHGDPQNQPGFAREVSSEWHVHLVRETDMLTQSRRYPLASKCEMCVQAPNGRKHSSLFAVHLIPHWLPSSGKRVGEPTTHMACTTQNIKAASCATDGWQEHDPTQRLRLTARLTDEATGEEFPDAVLFNAHPNGHLYGGSPDKETDVLCVPICGCIKVRARVPAGHAARRPAAPPHAPRPAAARRS